MNSAQRKTGTTTLESLPSVTPRLFKAAITGASIEVSEYLPASWRVSYESHDACVADLVLTPQENATVPPVKTEFSLDASFSRAPNGTVVKTTVTSQSGNDALLRQIFDRTQLVIATALR